MFLRAYLLCGLAAHKVVWEYLKHTQAVAAPNRGPMIVRIVKMFVLGGLLAQTVLPEILPICSSCPALRWTGLALFTAGLALAIAARITLGANWTDIEQGAVGQRHEVVARGVYRFIRHPIYTGDVLLVAGLELALNSWLVLGVLPLAAYVHVKASQEESKLVSALPGYAAYCTTTGRFLPRI
ncbi:MAG: isoprenylcysteine carboxylmethyltransferase family protein [Acidobacteriota bacterium]